jgi:hypothetical protein
MRALLSGTFLLSALAGALGAPADAPAQVTITLEGIVRGEDGSAIESAQVSAVETATSERRSALTNAYGEFRILGLSPGRYAVSARFIGYRPATETVRLVIGQRARLTFALERGATEVEAVQVREQRVRSVEVQRTSVSTPVLQEEIENLPLNTRNVMTLAAIAPGIRSFAPVQGRALPSAGAVPDLRFINLYLDGVEMKSLFNGNLVGIPQTGSPLPADALREFRVFLNPYDAEYSRAGAYVISAVTHRGTNELEGSAFGFFQNKDMVEQGIFQATEPDTRRVQAGFNVRGPLVRDRLFFATSYELSNTEDFIDVVPGRPAVAPSLWESYQGTFKAPNRNHTGLLRLTYAPNETNTLDAIWSSRYMTGESFFGGTVAHEGGISQKYFINTVNLRHQYLPAPRLVNELSLQLVSWSHKEPLLVERPEFIYSGIQIGRAGFPLEISETHLRLVDRATYSVDDWLGSHLLKGGLEVARVSGNQYFPINRFGSFDFRPRPDTSTFPQTATIAVGVTDPASDRDANSELTGWITGIYVNDEWRPIPNFTLNLGLRYDAEINTLNNDYTVPWADDPELAARPELRPYLNRGDRKNDLNNISPRLSFSWDVFGSGRTFLRGGAGIIYDRVPSFMGFQERRDATWRTYSFTDPRTTDPAVLRQRVVSGAVTATPSFTLLADKMNTPENRQVSVGLGQQITPTLGLNLDYIYQDVRNLYAMLNLNWLDRSRTPAARVLSPRYANINVWDDFARARLSALVGQLTYQPSRAVRLNFAYTLGSAKAEYDAVTAPNVPAAFKESFYVMQRTSGDERHRFVLSGLGTFPFGLTISGIATLASPRPFLTTLGTDANNNNFTGDDWIGGERFQMPDNGWKDWYRNLDLRLTQSLPLAGGARLQLIGEAFNITNTTNYSSYVGTGTLQNFGQPNGTFQTRRFQIGSRVEF